jgi:branched-chain amino acid transport system ATP-binding protein
VTAGARLVLENLSVSYGDFPALMDVSLDVPAGSVVALLGPNGAGKSTLARAVSGLIPAKAGRVELDGRDVTKMPPHRRRQAGITYIPEGRGIFPGLSVIDNLRMAVDSVGSGSARQEAIDRVVGIFPVLGQRKLQRAGSLSGGEQQMLGLARALAVTPRVIIADEMSLGLAPLVVNSMFERLRQVKDSGITIVLIEQFVHRALELADQAAILVRGSLGWSGPAADAVDEVLDRYLGENEPSASTTS